MGGLFGHRVSGYRHLGWGNFCVWLLAYFHTANICIWTRRNVFQPSKTCLWGRLGFCHFPVGPRPWSLTQPSSWQQYTQDFIHSVHTQSRLSLLPTHLWISGSQKPQKTNLIMVYAWINPWVFNEKRIIGDRASVLRVTFPSVRTAVDDSYGARCM